MSAFEHFPYTNFQDLNLDYILKELKSIADEIDDVNVTATAKRGANTSVDVSGSLKDGAINFDFTLEQETQASTTIPLMNGTASVGNELKYARGDHRHPSDTTKQDKLIFDKTGGIWEENGVLSNKWSTLTDVDLDTVTYNFQGFVLGASNIPSGAQANGELCVLARADGLYCKQIYTPYNINDIYVRNHINGNWYEWQKIGTALALLWTNASPESQFASQSLAITGTRHEAFLVTFRQSTTNANQVSLMLNNNGTYVGLGIAGNAIALRASSVSSAKTSIYFGNAIRHTTYGSAGTQDNSVMIPIAVYGLA